MKVVDRKTVIHNMGDTRTVQHFNQLLGDKPHKLGLVATMYPDLSITVLTDALRNIYYNPKGSSANFQPLNAMAVQWDIDVNYIHKINIVQDITDAQPGLNKIPFVLHLEQKYYDKNDTFRKRGGIR